MSKAFSLLWLLSIAMFQSPAFCAQQNASRVYTREDFINVDGPTLEEKFNRAVKAFRDSRQGDSAWIAYHFPARAGSQVDPFAGSVYYDDDGIRFTHRDNPDGAAVFMLADLSSDAPRITKIKTLNLGEPYVFENRPVYWLGALKTAESLAYLESVMRLDSENKLISRGALRAVAEHDSPRVIPFLKDVALKNPVPDIQRYAVGALARVPAKESLDALDEIFHSSAATSLLKQEIVAAYTLAGDQISERRVLDRLSSIAGSDEALKVRVEAVRRIASFRGDAILDRLIEIYDHSADRELKMEIIHRAGAAVTQDPRLLRRLVAIAKSDPDVELEREAVRRLSALRSLGGLDALIEAYDHIGSEALKDEIIARFSASPDRKALDKLLSIARSDPNSKLRQSAIHRLSSTRSYTLSVQ